MVAKNLLEDGVLFRTKKGKPVEMPVPLAPLADTHGHLTSFRKLKPEVAVARAALAGVRLLAVPVDPADDVPDVPAFLAWFEQVREGTARLLRELAREGVEPLTPPGVSAESLPPLSDNLYFLAGVHPYGARRFMEDPSIRERLEALLDDPRCVGVGEFGLDVGPWSELSLEEQVPAMREHLRIACERDLPAELHIRDGEGPLETAAHDCALELLREESLPRRGCVLHCFTSGPKVMEPFIELGCHVAFGGASTFGRSDDIRAAALQCPEQLLLCETDSPYMAPVPLRGRECEPAMVSLTAHNLACVREEADISSARQTYEALWHNALALFGLPQV